MNPENLKLIVREKYTEIAGQSKSQNQSSCCGASACSTGMDYTVFSDDYRALKGYHPEADLGLGCGLPTKFAAIKKGDHVLDLGSGAGNDCFVARTLVGETGKVTGLDFTDAMVEKAQKNLEKTGYTNIEFVKGDIEQMPLPEAAFDVVISNCVLNLVPDKERAFAEMYRVLKPGGHFCISDIVLEGDLPIELQVAAEMYAGCVSGAMQKREYLEVINNQGFIETTIHKEKPIILPEDILSGYLSAEEMRSSLPENYRITSITVNAIKPQNT